MRQIHPSSSPLASTKSLTSFPQTLPEITPKSIILGIILSMVIGGANAYLGLKVGLTVSACIPAAVMSIAVLRLFKNSNILENNIVQTTASAGEVIAAGTIFTLPALVMIGYWEHFSFGMTVCLTALGGILGVMISVPLRRALIIENPLRFPEGVATAEILKAGDRGTSGGNLQSLIWGGAWAAAVKFAQTGLQICAESFQFWVHSASTIIGFGGGYSLAIIGSGFIVGLSSCISIFTGGLIAWIIGVPLYGLLNGLPEGHSAAKIASLIWSSEIRMMGIGAMVVGGFWTVFALLKPIQKAIASSMEAFRKATRNKRPPILRTEKDIPFPYVFTSTIALGVFITGVVYYVFSTHNLEISSGLMGLSVLLIGFLVLVVSFLCSSIAGYMTGIMGASHSPLSGVVLISILIFSGILLFLLDGALQFSLNPERAIQAAATVILIGCVVACAAAVSGDNLQDLKSGQLVGSTPWKQQVMLIVGVVAGALAMAPVTELLFQAYGIGDVMPRPGMDPSQALSAPKAAMIAALSQSIFLWSMNWTLFFVGAIIAILAIFVDLQLKKKQTVWRLPVLGVAVGIYMPLEVTVPFVIGGIISFLADRSLQRKGIVAEEQVAHSKRKGTLIAAGLIAGESLMGVVLAVPFAIYQSTSVFAWTPPFLTPFIGPVGFVVTAYIGYILYRRSSQR